MKITVIHTAERRKQNHNILHTFHFSTLELAMWLDDPEEPVNANTNIKFHAYSRAMITLNGAVTGVHL